MITQNDAMALIKPLKPLPTGVDTSFSLHHPISALLFDVYGTLFISGSGDIGISEPSPIQQQTVNQLLKDYGIPQNADEIKNRLFAAIEQEHTRLKQNGVDYPEVEIDRIWMKILEISNPETIREFAVKYELAVNPVYPMPNLVEVLSTCQDSGMQLGIISNAQFYTLYLFKWFVGDWPQNLGFNPDLLFFSFQMGVAKPSLTMFEQAADQLAKRKIEPMAVLYVGNDMLKDIYPAKRIGFQTALFAGDARSLRWREDDPLCRNLKPDIVVTDLIQLINFLK